ncbi:MAG: 2-amino-4-hydroxy-6-hydroxymethyldihydropteridine diphosphokinase [Acidobacteriota bacterium]|nr:2-amino-4-hydroxy-6-hydroxymethyldihydropteridine diphosphokinase [Acidobacteriota bacterium]
MSRPERRVAVALGSNLGDRVAHLDYAVARLGRLLSDVVVSTLIATPPEHAADEPMFLNGAVVGVTDIAPTPLLDALLAIEHDRGRVRSYQGAPRTLDLDLVLHGELMVESARLSLPHPRFRTRTFVLEPLVEIAPSMVDPVTGKTVQQLLNSLLERHGELP